MICAHSSFFKDLEEIIHEAHVINEDFQSEICEAKCQIWNFVRTQIQDFKSRKNFAHSTPRESVDSSLCLQVDVCTETCPEYNSFCDESLKSTTSFETIGTCREDAELKKSFVTRSVCAMETDIEENPLPSCWFQISTKLCKFFSAIAIGFLVWIALVYGILLGISIYSNESCLFTSSRRSAIL